MFFVHILLQEFQIGFYFEVESSQEMQCVHSVQAVVHQKHIDRANSCLFLHFLTADHFENSFIQSLGVKEQEGAARWGAATSWWLKSKFEPQISAPAFHFDNKSSAIILFIDSPYSRYEWSDLGLLLLLLQTVCYCNVCLPINWFKEKQNYSEDSREVM